MNTDFRFLLTLLAAASLTLTACGDSEDPTDGQDAGMDAAMDVEEDMGGEDMGEDADEDMGGEDMGEDADEDMGTDDMGTEDMGTDDMGNDADGGGMMGMSIKEIRTNSTIENLGLGESTSEEYTVTDVVVTGVQGSPGDFGGFFAQDASGSAENSGLWFYLGGETTANIPDTLSRGDVISATGIITNYDNNGNSTEGGQLEMESLTSFSIDTEDGTVPAPVTISDASSIATGGSQGEIYEGVLVEVSGQTVASWDPGNNFGEVEFESGLRLDDKLYDYPSDFSSVSSGDTFSTVRGILDWSFDDRKVQVREMSDLTLQSQ
jgi:hypothetical protein